MVEALTRSAIETHFEVHVMKSGRWMIEATTREQKIALTDAKDLLRHGDVRGVKVFKESTNTNNGRTSAISIFNQIKPELRKSAHRAIARNEVKPLVIPMSAQMESAPRASVRTNHPEGQSRIVATMITATIIVMGSLAGVYLYSISDVASETDPVAITIGG